MYLVSLSERRFQFSRVVQVSIFSVDATQVSVFLGWYRFQFFSVNVGFSWFIVVNSDDWWTPRRFQFSQVNSLDGRHAGSSFSGERILWGSLLTR